MLGVFSMFCYPASYQVLSTGVCDSNPPAIIPVELLICKIGLKKIKCHRWIELNSFCSDLVLFCLFKKEAALTTWHRKGGALLWCFGGLMTGRGLSGKPSTSSLQEEDKQHRRGYCECCWHWCDTQAGSRLHHGSVLMLISCRASRCAGALTAPLSPCAWLSRGIFEPWLQNFPVRLLRGLSWISVPQPAFCRWAL